MLAMIAASRLGGMLERQHEGIATVKREGRYKPTVRRQWDHPAQRCRRQLSGIAPCDWVQDGRPCIGYWTNGQASVGRREANAHRVQGFGSSGVPQLLRSGLIDMP
jgi:hypothetical protein